MKVLNQVLKTAFVNMNYKVKIKHNAIRKIVASKKITNLLLRNLMMKSRKLEQRLDSKIKRLVGQ